VSLSLIYKEKVSKIKPILWYGQPVILKYREIFSILKDRISSDILDIFLIPDIQTDSLSGATPIKWFSNRYKQLKPYHSFDKKEQEIINDIFKNKIIIIENLIKELKSSSNQEEQELADFLSNILEIPTIDYIFSDGKNIALAFWSFKSIETQYKDFSIRKLIPTSITSIPSQQEPPKEIKEETITNSIPKEDIKSNSNRVLKILLAVLLSLIVILVTIIAYKYIKEYFNKKVDTVEVIDENDTLKKSVVSGGLIITLKEDVDINKFAIRIKQSYPDIEIIEKQIEIGVVKLQVPNSKVQFFQKTLSKDRDILSIKKERIYSSSYIPNDSGFQKQKKNWGFQAINAFKAWDITKGKKSILIAIIDVGFDITHSEIDNNIKSTQNIVENSKISDSYKYDIALHGTHVSAIAGGEIDNRLGVSGVAPNCSLLLLQVGSSKTGIMSENSIIKAIIYAINHGADVINISLGSKFNFDFNRLNITQKETIREIYKRDTISEEILWKRIYNYAKRKNVTIVTASGNDNMYSDIDPMKRSQDIISVGATNSNGKRAEYSNYGSNVVISAPGSDIYSAVPNGAFAYLSGTSIASPFVAGAVALIKSINPNLTPIEIKNILIKTGKTINTNPNTPIGKLIQLDKLIKSAKNRPDIYHRNRELKERLEECRGQKEKRKFIIPPKPKDFKFAKGLWRSTSDIRDGKTQKPIQLYFNLEDNGKGKLEVHLSNGDICSAYIELSFNNHILSIIQKSNAVCEKENKAFNKYKFHCKSENNQDAICNANGLNRFTFGLRKVD